MLYNVNVATTITSQGRSLVSSMCMQFEMFLNDNVQFGSINEVLQFIDNIKSEAHTRRYNDMVELDDYFAVKPQDVFYKLVKNCTWRWVINEEEMDILWKVINNLNQEDLNRVWYKNNLFEFCENSKVFNRVRNILKKLNRPLFNSLEIPEEIADDIKEFGDLLMEYVYYKYMIIDRVDKCDNMIKSVVMVLDTDSNIVSLDGWYRYVSEKISGEEFNITNYDIPMTIFDVIEGDTFNFDKFPARYKNTDAKNNWMQCMTEANGSKYDYDFDTDEIVEMDHFNHPEVITCNDNMRYSIMNILAYVLDRVVNDYMNQYCINNNSVYKDPNDKSKYYRKCRIIAKNEFRSNI